MGKKALTFIILLTSITLLVYSIYTTLLNKDCLPLVFVAMVLFVIAIVYTNEG